MLLRYFYDKGLAQASYMVGCQQTGEALVIDPARDIAPYLAAAEEEGLRITHVTETHIHADFVSGARELAAHTGATLFLSGEGGADWKYAFADDNTTLLHEGEGFMLGNVKIDVLHTPGHTPEHLCFLITDTLSADTPMGIVTGDCLFVGDVGRPDLLETAAGIKDTKERGAREQFHNMQRLRQLPDHLQVLPGHGAGSACGKSLGALPSSTIGYEKLYNPAFQFTDENSFAAWLLEGQPETPRYFGQMKRVNKQGPALLDSLKSPAPMEAFFLDDVLRDGALVIDARADEQVIPGALRIPPSTAFPTYAGWFIDYAKPTYLIADEAQLERLVRDLRAIGVDHLPGYFVADDLDARSVALNTVTPEEAEAQIDSGAFLLDVRAASEYAEDHIEGAVHIHYGELPQHLDSVPRDQQVIIHCASGVRSQIASSTLLRAGYKEVAHIDGGFDAWKAHHRERAQA